LSISAMPRLTRAVPVASDIYYPFELSESIEPIDTV